MVKFRAKEAKLLQLLYDRPTVNRFDIQDVLFDGGLRSSSAHRAQMAFLRRKIRLLRGCDLIHQDTESGPVTNWWIKEADKPLVAEILKEYYKFAETNRRRLEFLSKLRTILITSQGEMTDTAGNIVDQMQTLLPQEKIDEMRTKEKSGRRHCEDVYLGYIAT